VLRLSWLFLGYLMVSLGGVAAPTYVPRFDRVFRFKQTTFSACLSHPPIVFEVTTVAMPLHFPFTYAVTNHNLTLFLADRWCLRAAVGLFTPSGANNWEKKNEAW
jgi:hypothetical protein